MPNMFTRSYQKSFDVNINDFPQVDKKAFASPGAQITIGDLHGNALKLLHFLIKHGVFSGLSAAEYGRFVLLYHKSVEAITKSDLDEFNRILADKIKVNSAATIRLLGDDLADRGANDYFTLKILDKLFANKVPVEIILSNHTGEFIEAFEKNKPYVSVALGGQAISMANLQQLITNGLVSRKEIDSIFKNQYLPNLKIISYTLDESAQKISLFSHAPIGINNIKYLADKLGVAYDDSSIYKLARTLDTINEKFMQNYVLHNKAHELFSEEAIVAVDSGIPNAPKEHPFAFCIWNRSYQGLVRPRALNGYSFKFIHGHDNREKTQPGYIYNLDNMLGKRHSLHRETYKIHYTHETQLKNIPGQNIAQQTPASVSTPTPARALMKSALIALLFGLLVTSMAVASVYALSYALTFSMIAVCVVAGIGAGLFMTFASASSRAAVLSTTTSRTTPIVAECETLKNYTPLKKMHFQCANDKMQQKKQAIIPDWISEPRSCKIK